MKKILISLAQRFRKFTANASGNNAASVAPFQTSVFSEKEDGFELGAKIPSSITTILPGASRPQSDIQSQQALVKPSAMESGNSFPPDFVTREELKRELDLLHRLIESRK